MEAVLYVAVCFNVIVIIVHVFTYSQAGFCVLSQILCYILYPHICQFYVLIPFFALACSSYKYVSMSVHDLYILAFLIMFFVWLSAHDLCMLACLLMNCEVVSTVVFHGKDQWFVSGQRCPSYQLQKWVPGFFQSWRKATKHDADLSSSNYSQARKIFIPTPYPLGAFMA